MRFAFCYRVVEGREIEASKDPSHDIEPESPREKRGNTRASTTTPTRVLLVETVSSSSYRDGQGFKRLAAEPSTDPC